jgi:hypothetical protein
LVVEIASNDGYLLQYVKAKGIPVIDKFFGTKLDLDLKNKGSMIYYDIFRDPIIKTQR